MWFRILINIFVILKVYDDKTSRAFWAVYFLLSILIIFVGYLFLLDLLWYKEVDDLLLFSLILNKILKKVKKQTGYKVGDKEIQIVCYVENHLLITEHETINVNKPVQYYIQTPYPTNTKNIGKQRNEVFEKNIRSVSTISWEMWKY